MDEEKPPPLRCSNGALWCLNALLSAISYGGFRGGRPCDVTTALRLLPPPHTCFPSDSADNRSCSTRG